MWASHTRKGHTMNHPADTDTTARRYFTAAEIAAIVQAMNRGFAIVLGEPRPRDWDQLTQAQQLRWVSAVEEYRRGTSAQRAYEDASGLPWSGLERDDQIRLETGQLLVTMLGTMQR